VFFRREDDGGILIVRVLHQSMLPELHGFEDEDDA
jgi:plasmid stabilization system protein ParE